MMNDTTTSPPSEPPAPAPSPRRITRPRDDRLIAGVASGIARHFDVDPWLVRIILLVLIPFGGVGFLLYLAGWLLLPEEGDPDSLAGSWLSGLRGSSAWLGVILIAVAVVWLLASTELISAGLAWAVALLVLGVLLYTGRIPVVFLDTGRVRELRSHERPERAETAVGREADPAAPLAPETPVRQRSRRRRPRAVLLRLTTGTLLITLGAMALLDVAGAIYPDPRHYFGAAVLVVGLGLLVGSIFGRSRGLIVIGLLLLPPLLASAAVTAPFTGGWGDPVHRPLAVSEVPDAYRLAGGEMQLNLASLPLEAGETIAVTASVGAGRLLVFVPVDAALDLTGHVGFGNIRVFGSDDGGIDVDRTFTTTGSTTFDLDLDVGFGQIEIVRAGTPDARSPFDGERRRLGF
jgi:phage shock protein PspC (stress-responsive transcriptional regulator)